MPTAEENAATAQAAILAALAGPKRVRTDAGEVEQYDLADLIRAAEFAQSVAVSPAARTPLRGIRNTKLIPPGTT